VDAVVKWYGEQFTRRPHYGTVFYAAQQGDSNAVGALIRIIGDPLFPPIVRATAVSLLSRFPQKKSMSAVKTVLTESEDLIRYAAVNAFQTTREGDLLKTLAPFLQDRVKAIRILAANRLGKNDRAEALLRQIIKQNPDMNEAYYSLGLLLAEKKDYKTAARYLQKAAQTMPQRSRIHYKGLLLQHLNRLEGAEESLKTASQLEPLNEDYLYALADFYIKTGRLKQAKDMAERLQKMRPSNRLTNDMLNYIKKQREAQKN